MNDLQFDGHVCIGKDGVPLLWQLGHPRPILDFIIIVFWLLFRIHVIILVLLALGVLPEEGLAPVDFRPPEAGGARDDVPDVTEVTLLLRAREGVDLRGRGMLAEFAKFAQICVDV